MYRRWDFNLIDWGTGLDSENRSVLITGSTPVLRTDRTAYKGGFPGVPVEGGAVLKGPKGALY